MKGTPGALLSSIFEPTSLAQISPFTAAPMAVAFVVSEVTVPVTSSSARLPAAAIRPSSAIRLAETGRLAVLPRDRARSVTLFPLLLPEPPVFLVGVQPEKLSLAFPLEG